MSTRTFRFLILTYVVLLAAAGVVDFVFPQLVPAAASHALEEIAPAPGLEQWWFAALAIPWAIALLVGAVGLLFLWKWARSLCLWATVVGFAIYPLFGPTVSSAWATALGEASATLWGVILAVSYFSPLAARFGAGK